MMRGRFGLFGALFLVLFVLVVGGIGFALGQANAPAAATPDGVRVVYGFGFGFWHPFGWIFGLFFLFFILWLVFGLLRPRRWGGGDGWGGWGGRGYGPGGWGGPGARFDANDPNAPDWMRDVPPNFRPMLDNWHRRVHGNAGPTPPGPTTPTTPPDRRPTTPSDPTPPGR